MSRPVAVQEKVPPPVATASAEHGASRSEVGPTMKADGANGRKTGLLALLTRAVPTTLTLAVLGILGYGGHHTGWKIPKFSQVVGATHAERDDWCAEHNVPESQCIACNAELLPKEPEQGWCKEHGVAECVLCHPELAQVKGEPPQPQHDVKAALELKARTENEPKCKTQRRRLQFASKEALAKAGIDVEVADERPIVEVVTGYGEITYDQTRVARLSTRVPGTVWRVDRQVGDPVKKGDVLAMVDAADVGRAKAELLQNLALVELKTKTLDRIRPLAEKGSISQAQLQEAEAALKEARVRLHNAQQTLINLGLSIRVEDVQGLSEEKLAERVRTLGLPDAVTSTFDHETTTANLLPLAAPFDGVVVSREVVAGEVVNTEKTLFVVADVSRMWVTVGVGAEDAASVVIGQPLIFRPDASPDDDATGTVSWISTAVDDATRTVKVRADVQNLTGKLRANSFGTGRIVLREDKHAVVVPIEAVHWEGCCHIVFVRDKHFHEEGWPKFFIVRKVRPGVRDAKYREMIAGILPGEVIASKGSATLRAELLKNKLGAG